MRPSPRLAWEIGATIIGVIGALYAIMTVPTVYRTPVLTLIFIILGAIGAMLILALLRRLGLLEPRALPLPTPVPRSVRLVPATEHDIAWMGELESRHYGPDAIPETILREWFERNPGAFTIVKDADNQRIGHLDVLPIRPATLRMLVNGDIQEVGVRGECIFASSERADIADLYVESVIVDAASKWARGQAVWHMCVNMLKIVDRVADADRVQRVYALAATANGATLLEHLGFEVVCQARRRRDHHDMYSVEFAGLAARLERLFDTDPKERERLRRLSNRQAPGAEDTIA